MTDFLVAIAVVFIAAAAIFAVAFILMSASQNGARQQKGAAARHDDGELSTGTKLMIGAMGAELLNHQIEKHKRISEEKRKDLFQWQDAIRKDD